VSVFQIFYFLFLFLFYFLFFFEFLKKLNKLPHVKLSSCHMAVIEWCGSNSDTCQYYARCHFLSLNLVPLF